MENPKEKCEHENKLVNRKFSGHFINEDGEQNGFFDVVEVGCSACDETTYAFAE